MYRIVILLCPILVIFSCNTKSENEDKAIESSENQCYMLVMGKDTISMNIQVSDNFFQGTMHYDNYQKDGSTGDYKGLIENDTLIGEYHFFSEGMESWRELVFLRKGDDLQEGIGEVMEKEGKMKYSDRSKLNFDGMTLKAIDCDKYKKPQ